MGYYTYYTLTVYDNKEGALGGGMECQNSERVMEAAVELASEVFSFSEDELKCLMSTSDPMGFIFNGDEKKWYKHDTDMCNLSRKFPDLWFRLEGLGEDREDTWITVYHRGKQSTATAEIYYPPLCDEWEDER